MKVKLLFYLFGTIMLFASCKDIYDVPKTIEACVYSLKEDVTVTNIALKAPSGMSSFYYGAIPSDKIIRSLTQALWQGNFWSSKNLGKVYGDLKSSGKTCTGDRVFSYNAGNSRIGGNYLNLDLPKGVNFLGTVTMLIRSDDYKTSDPNVAEYVLWSGSGNDPQFEGINGNITGARKLHNTLTGKLSIVSLGKDGCYYKDGLKSCP